VVLEGAPRLRLLYLQRLVAQRLRMEPVLQILHLCAQGCAVTIQVAVLSLYQFYLIVSLLLRQRPCLFVRCGIGLQSALFAQQCFLSFEGELERIGLDLLLVSGSFHVTFSLTKLEFHLGFLLMGLRELLPYRLDLSLPQLELLLQFCGMAGLSLRHLISGLDRFLKAGDFEGHFVRFNLEFFPRFISGLNGVSHDAARFGLLASQHNLDLLKLNFF
jgi:hypothetical protein